MTTAPSQVTPREGAGQTNHQQQKGKPMTTPSATAPPAYVYWPHGGPVQDAPRARLHEPGWAVVDLSLTVTVHVRTAAQAHAIAAAFTAAAGLLHDQGKQ